MNKITRIESGKPVSICPDKLKVTAKMRKTMARENEEAVPIVDFKI
jgi:hypothetical protein